MHEVTAIACPIDPGDYRMDGGELFHIGQVIKDECRGLAEGIR